MTSPELAGDGLPELRAKPLPRQRYRPDPRTSPKHRPGFASPRTSPLRTPRPLEIPARSLEAARRIMAVEMDPLTAIGKVYTVLPLPDGVRAFLAIVVESAKSNHGTKNAGRCTHRSYQQIADDSVQDRNTAIAHGALAEAFDLLVVHPRGTTETGRLRNGFEPRLPRVLLDLLDGPAANDGEDAGDELVEDVAGDELPEIAEFAPVPVERALVLWLEPLALARAVDAPPLVPATDARETEIVAAQAELRAWADERRQARHDELRRRNSSLQLGARPTRHPAEIAVEERELRAKAEEIVDDRRRSAAAAATKARPRVVEGAILELVRQHPAVASTMKVPLSAFAETVATMARRQGITLERVLVGLETAATTPDPKGRAYQHWGIACVKTEDLRHGIPACVQPILRRAELGETAASCPSSSSGTSGPGPPSAS